MNVSPIWWDAFSQGDTFHVASQSGTSPRAGQSGYKKVEPGLVQIKGQLQRPYCPILPYQPVQRSDVVGGLETKTGWVTTVVQQVGGYF
jgi:hypothetical protein